MADKIIDPGNEPSTAKPHTLPWLIDFIRRHKGASVTPSESMLLLGEIDRLQKELDRMTESRNELSTYGH